MSAYHSTVRLLALVAILVLLTPLAHSEKKPKISPGPATVTINAPIERVREIIVRLASVSGLTIETDTTYQMTLSRPIKTDLITAMEYGANASVREALQFQFVKVGESVMLTVISEQIVTSADGSRHVPMNSAKERKVLQDMLDQIKMGLELEHD